MSKAESISVSIRLRPFSKKEKAAGADKYGLIVRCDEAKGIVQVDNPEKSNEDPKNFFFDTVYGDESLQQTVYDKTCRPIVQGIFEGFNGTIFAYGQTGTGKTWTMEGLPHDPNLKGVIPNAFNHIITSIGLIPDRKFLVRVAFLEIYNENIRDLLVTNPKQVQSLSLHESPNGGVYVKNLSQHVVKSADEMMMVMDRGKLARSVGATDMNPESSRSHSIFTITLEIIEMAPNGKPIVKTGKLSLVDLAGSERQSKTNASGERLVEATKINLSLSALGNVISALTSSKKAHVPYRDSVLTRLLEDSLGGNARTAMIATCGPAASNYNETLSTLRYASRAKEIKNKPKVNFPKDAMYGKLQEEIAQLKAKLKEIEEKTRKEMEAAIAIAAQKAKEEAEANILAGGVSRPIDSQPASRVQSASPSPQITDEQDRDEEPEKKPKKVAVKEAVEEGAEESGGVGTSEPVEKKKKKQKKTKSTEDSAPTAGQNEEQAAVEKEAAGEDDGEEAGAGEKEEKVRTKVIVKKKIVVKKIKDPEQQRLLEELQKQKELEKNALESEKQAIAEEKARIEAELAEREKRQAEEEEKYNEERRLAAEKERIFTEELEKQRERVMEQERMERELQERLEMMEAQFVEGGKLREDAEAAHEEELTRLALEQEQLRQAHNDAIEREKEEKKRMEKEKEDLEGNVDQLKKKIKDLRRQLKDQEEEFEHEREDQMDTIRVLLEAEKMARREQAKLECIVAQFIPLEYVEAVEAAMHFDEEAGEWEVKATEARLLGRSDGKKRERIVMDSKGEVDEGKSRKGKDTKKTSPQLEKKKQKELSQSESESDDDDDDLGGLVINGKAVREKKHRAVKKRTSGIGRTAYELEVDRKMKELLSKQQDEAGVQDNLGEIFLAPSTIHPHQPAPDELFPESTKSKTQTGRSLFSTISATHSSGTSPIDQPPVTRPQPRKSPRPSFSPASSARHSLNTPTDEQYPVAQSSKTSVRSLHLNTALSPVNITPNPNDSGVPITNGRLSSKGKRKQKVSEEEFPVSQAALNSAHPTTILASSQPPPADTTARRKERTQSPSTKPASKERAKSRNGVVSQSNTVDDEEFPVSSFAAANRPPPIISPQLPTKPNKSTSKEKPKTKRLIIPYSVEDEEEFPTAQGLVKMKKSKV